MNELVVERFLFLADERALVHNSSRRRRRSSNALLGRLCGRRPLRRFVRHWNVLEHELLARSFARAVDGQAKNVLEGVARSQLLMIELDNDVAGAQTACIGGVARRLVDRVHEDGHGAARREAEQRHGVDAARRRQHRRRRQTEIELERGRLDAERRRLLRRRRVRDVLEHLARLLAHVLVVELDDHVADADARRVGHAVCVHIRDVGASVAVYVKAVRLWPR